MKPGAHFAGPTREPLCENCGAPMHERFRLTEGATTYVWFECTRADCVGQLLRKEPFVPLPGADRPGRAASLG